MILLLIKDQLVLIKMGNKQAKVPEKLYFFNSSYTTAHTLANSKSEGQNVVIEVYDALAKKRSRKEPARSAVLNRS